MACWEDYERLAGEHLAGLVGQARLTAAGTDSGIDLVGPNLVGQVKATMRPSGRPELQRLVGAAMGQSAVFYALGGFTREAVAYAEETGVALFEFTVTGAAVPRNNAARGLGHSDQTVEMIRLYEKGRAVAFDSDYNCGVCFRLSSDWAAGDERASLMLGNMLMNTCHRRECWTRGQEIMRAVAPAYGLDPNDLEVQVHEPDET